MQLGIAEESGASEADGTPRAAAAAAAQQQRDDDDDDNDHDDEEGRGGGAGLGSSSKEGAATGVVDDASRGADGDGDYGGADGDDNTNSMKKFCADYEVTARERLDALSEHRRGAEAEGAEEGDADKDDGIVYSDEESDGHDGEQETDDAPFVAPEDDHDGDGNDNDKDNDADEDHREAKREEFRRQNMFSQRRRNSSRCEHHNLPPCLEPLSRLLFHENHSPPENVHRTHSPIG